MLVGIEKNMRYIPFFAAALVFASLQVVCAQKKNDFALYLLADVRPAELSRLDGTKIERPKTKPLVTTRFVVSYLKNLHRLTIAGNAVKRIRLLDVPPEGRSFVVFAGGSAIYTGAFWKGKPQENFTGVFIDVTDKTGSQLNLTLDYRGRETVADQRSDERIWSVLRSAGVLFEQVWLAGRCREVLTNTIPRDSIRLVFNVTANMRSVFESQTVRFDVAKGENNALLDALEIVRNPTGAGKAAAKTPFPDKVDDKCSKKELLLKFKRRIAVAPGARDDLIFEDFEVLKERKPLRLPGKDEVLRIEIESGCAWYSPSELLVRLSDFKAADDEYLVYPTDGKSYLDKQCLQRGSFVLKNGERILWAAADAYSIVIYEEDGQSRHDRIYVYFGKSVDPKR